MKDRRAARRLAVDALYESEITDELPLDAFSALRSAGWVAPSAEDADVGTADPSDEAVAYAESLVERVQANHADIDSIIARYADRWAIDRMPVIDRILLRIALVELLWASDVPVAVAINEAVELAKALSTDDSGRFINGVLGRVVEERPPLR
ncbi:MAG: transcription antitermination factor NusB [Actinomycetota bacterium]|nr:transcription antitermination factor NusB [Actinomycetota bacterium]